MFYHIEGIVSELGQNLAVLDCGGLGFALNVTANTLSRLKNGDKVKLYVTESIGETNFDLFGFFDKGESDAHRPLGFVVRSVPTAQQGHDSPLREVQG